MVRNHSRLPHGRTLSAEAPSERQLHGITQQAIIAALRFMPLDLAGLAEEAGRPAAVIRAELQRLRHAGYGIRFEDGEYHLDREPGRRQCANCGAYLRRGKDGLYCDPCVAAGARQAVAPEHDPTLRDRILVALMAHEAEKVNVAALMGCSGDEHARNVIKAHIRALRRRGHRIEGHYGRSPGYSWHGMTDEGAPAA